MSRTMTVTRDRTAEYRPLCEAHRSHATWSLHPCASCGRVVPWAELRWVELEGVPGVVPVHDCPKYPLRYALGVE